MCELENHLQTLKCINKTTLAKKITKKSTVFITTYRNRRAKKSQPGQCPSESPRLNLCCGFFLLRTLSSKKQNFPKKAEFENSPSLPLPQFPFILNPKALCRLIEFITLQPRQGLAGTGPCVILEPEQNSVPTRLCQFALSVFAFCFCFCF